MSGRQHLLDAHGHIWDDAQPWYPWLSRAPRALRRPFSLRELDHEAAAAEVAGIVLVQAADQLAETRFLLDEAAAVPRVAGVVGWLPLDDADLFARALDRYRGEPLLRGVRHLVHEDPRADFLDRATVRRSLQRLAEAGLAFDVPDAWPRHLGQVAAVAEAVPELVVVLDHLGKPPRGTDRLPAWRDAVAAVAARPNTVAKLSGLQVPTAPFTADALRGVLDDALALFGPARLMWGSDWPMTVEQGGYSQSVAVLHGLLVALSPDERGAILAGTAQRVYRLPVR